MDMDRGEVGLIYRSLFEYSIGRRIHPALHEDLRSADDDQLANRLRPPDLSCSACMIPNPLIRRKEEEVSGSEMLVVVEVSGRWTYVRYI